MKINWTTIIIWVIGFCILIGVYFGIKRYFDGRITHVPNTVIEDSLRNQLIIVNRQKLELEKEIIAGQGEKLKLTGEAKYYKNKYHEEKNNEHIYVVLPTTDSAKHVIVTEYFIEQNIPLHYSR